MNGYEPAMVADAPSKSAQPRALSQTFTMSSIHRPPQIKLPPLSSVATTTQSGQMKSRGRSSSIVKMEEVGDHSTEETLDQSAYVNINASWVNAKGDQNVLCPLNTVIYASGM
jgi:hypothetical protein